MKANFSMNQFILSFGGVLFSTFSGQALGLVSEPLAPSGPYRDLLSCYQKVEKAKDMHDSPQFGFTLNEIENLIRSEGYDETEVRAIVSTLMKEANLPNDFKEKVMKELEEVQAHMSGKRSSAPSIENLQKMYLSLDRLQSPKVVVSVDEKKRKVISIREDGNAYSADFKLDKISEDENNPSRVNLKLMAPQIATPLYMQYEIYHQKESDGSELTSSGLELGLSPDVQYKETKMSISNGEEARKVLQSEIIQSIESKQFVGEKEIEPNVEALKAALEACLDIKNLDAEFRDELNQQLSKIIASAPGLENGKEKKARERH